MSSFTLIGERLNTHRERFEEKVRERDAAAVRREAQRQLLAGVTHLDLNTSASAENETADMLWLLDTVLPAISADVGVVIDTVSGECLRKALEKVGDRPGTLINAISNEFTRIQSALPLAVKHGAGVIAILSDQASPARSADERLATAEQLHKILCDAKIDEDLQYYDPQVLPVAFDPGQPLAILETIREIRRRWPLTHTLVGLSNVSFNMPNRPLLNRTYVGMLLASGIDGMIFDPCDAELRETLIAARALLGQDEFLTAYLAEIKPED